MKPSSALPLSSKTRPAYSNRILSPMANNFPTRAPVGLISGGLPALISVVPILAAWYFIQLPVQKFYFGEYVASYLSQTLVGTVAGFFRHSPGHTYYVLMQNGHPLSGSVPETGSAISVRVIHTRTPTRFHTWLRTAVYDGRELP